ncbi:MAG: hypothetical protein R3B41_01410 [Candidatus Doudnabacteria bacterium]
MSNQDLPGMGGYTPVVPNYSLDIVEEPEEVIKNINTDHDQAETS